MRCRHEIEEGRGDRASIVLTSIPYQVGKSGLVEKIAEAAKDKRIEGISDIRDESSREGVRVVIDLKRDATPEVVLNQMWRTPRRSRASRQHAGDPRRPPGNAGLRDIIQAFIAFREEVITRRTKFELNKARDRAHILLGLVVAVTNLDEVVAIIRGSPNPAEARAALLAREWPIGDIAPISAWSRRSSPTPSRTAAPIACPNVQVKAILDLRLHRLTALGRDEIGDELKELAIAIAEYLSILADRVKLYGVMRAELVAIREPMPPRACPKSPRCRRDRGRGPDRARRDGRDRHARRLHQAHPALHLPRPEPRRQGPRGMATKDEDAVSTMFVTSTHNPVLFFSTAGKVYRLKVWRCPKAARHARPPDRQPAAGARQGRDHRHRAAAARGRGEAGASSHVVFATAKGSVRRNSMDAFANIPSNGKFAMRFEDGSDDRLIGVALLEPSDDVLLATRQGKAIRFAGDECANSRAAPPPACAA
jgi:DNA gyrase subunit A